MHNQPLQREKDQKPSTLRLLAWKSRYQSTGGDLETRRSQSRRRGKYVWRCCYVRSHRRCRRSIGESRSLSFSRTRQNFQRLARALSSWYRGYTACRDARTERKSRDNDGCAPEERVARNFTSSRRMWERDYDDGMPSRLGGHLGTSARSVARETAAFAVCGSSVTVNWRHVRVFRTSFIAMRVLALFSLFRLVELYWTWMFTRTVVSYKWIGLCLR